MITLLNLEAVPDNNSLKDRIRSFIPRRAIRVQDILYHNLTIRDIDVLPRGKKVPWNKISRIIGNCGDKILCSEDIIFPDSFNFSRYESLNFPRILCINAAIEVLKLAKVPQNRLLFTILDPFGCYYELLPRILPFAGQIKVITKNLEFYTAESENLMDQYGVSILISDSQTWARPCDVLIAPDRITQQISLVPDCITFTSSYPAVPLTGTVYYKYSLHVPELLDILPSNIEPAYFLGAIFDNYHSSELDYIVPQSCESVLGKESILEISQKLGNKHKSFLT